MIIKGVGSLNRGKKSVQSYAELHSSMFIEINNFRRVLGMAV